MELERERGITIKLQPVRMLYRMPISKSQSLNPKQFQNSNIEIQNNLEISDSEYILNLIDRPGHVDFSYEVSRSLAAAEGAVLLVDATQGVQAQTVANTFLSLEAGLEIIPVINKIDSINARVDETIEEMHNSLGIKPNEILKISAKEGIGVEMLMEEIIKRVPSPRGNVQSPLQAL